jgi:hypothetical protein
VCFKRKYKELPYYPVISLFSKSPVFIKSISNYLKILGLKVFEMYDYKIMDSRFQKGFSLISRIDLNGRKNFRLWTSTIGFSSPKHLNKIRECWKEKK